MTVFLDMDGVLADFDSAVKEKIFDPPEMFEKRFFRDLKVMPGAKSFVRWALRQPYLDLYIASKPLTKRGILYSATEKLEWVKEHFPELLDKTSLVSDKGLLLGSVLVDDDKKAWGDKFRGVFFHFDKDHPASSFRRLRDMLQDIGTGVGRGKEKT
jgi:5'(3')-deoxyribonucleotidase